MIAPVAAACLASVLVARVLGAAPYALLMVLLSMPLTWLLYIQSKRSAGR